MWQAEKAARASELPWQAEQSACIPELPLVVNREAACVPELPPVADREATAPEPLQWLTLRQPLQSSLDWPTGWLVF